MSSFALESPMQGKRELCMFCGKDDSFGPMTREHFVPRALWDGPRPTYTKTVPAHATCNSSFSEDNEYFRDVLILQHGADHHSEVQKLYTGKIQRKQRSRRGSLKNTLKDFAYRAVNSTGGVYLGHAPTFSVQWSRMERVLLNVMKGIFYTVREKPMPQDWAIKVAPTTDVALTPMVELIAQMCPWQTFGDDVFMTRYIFLDDDVMYCLMQFYRIHVFTGRA